VRVVLVVIAIWFAVAFLLGPLVGRVLKHGHIRPTTGPPPLAAVPAPDDPATAPAPEPDEDGPQES
jgi:hypothetical protein